MKAVQKAFQQHNKNKTTTTQPMVWKRVHGEVLSRNNASSETAAKCDSLRPLLR
jgi:hypothetical protein